MAIYDIYNSLASTYSGAESWQNISLVDNSTKFGMLVHYLVPE